ncbi:hypothetical protein BH10PAT1_BH10PAT1_4310 [soil metagenome]
MLHSATLQRAYLNTVIINKKKQKGQSFFEVIVAMALISIVLITLVALASVSIRASAFSRNQTQASRFTGQAAEWLTAEKSASWTTFLVHASTPQWCLTSLSWLQSGDCSDFISGTIFTRTLNLTKNADGSVSADVVTQWEDAQGVHSVPTSVIFTNK